MPVNYCDNCYQLPGCCLCYESGPDDDDDDGDLDDDDPNRTPIVVGSDLPPADMGDPGA